MAEVLMFDMTDTPPAEGFYAVKLGRGCALRALGVICNSGLWQVFLDGQRVDNPSLNWKEAFGWLIKLWALQGEKLSRTDYLELVTLRTKDRLEGVDLTKPLNRSTERTSI